MQPHRHKHLLRLFTNAIENKQNPVRAYAEILAQKHGRPVASKQDYAEMIWRDLQKEVNYILRHTGGQPQDIRHRLIDAIVEQNTIGASPTYDYDNHDFDQQTDSESNGMNTTNTVSLLIEDIRTVKAVFPGSNKRYTYKTLDATIEKDDFIVVYSPQSHNFQVIQVVEVDKIPDIDPQGRYNIAWVVQRVDVDSHDALRDMEDSLADQLKTVQQLSVREQVLNGLRTSIAGDPQATEALNKFVKSAKSLGHTPTEDSDDSRPA